MAGLTTSAGAVDIYSTTNEAEPLLKSSALMSTYDSVISVTAVEPSDLDDYLSYGSYSVADYFASLNQYFWGTTVPKYSGYTLITNLTELFRDFFNSAGFYLRDDGSSSNVNYSNNLADLVRMGFLGLSTNVKAVTSAIQSLDFNDYSSILSSIYSSVDGLESGLTSANTAIGGVTTAVNNVRTAVNDVLSVISTVNTSLLDFSSLFSKSIFNFGAGTSYLPSTGKNYVSNTGFTFADMIRHGFSGLATNLVFSGNQNFLNENGGISVTQSDGVTFQYGIRSGLLGLRNYMESQLLLPINRYHLNTSGNRIMTDSPWPLATNIEQGFVGVGALFTGTSGVNSYKSILSDNNNSTTTVYSTGLGPLLNTQLSNIGENLGHLAYVFASDDEIKLKHDSEPLMEEVGSIYDNSDSKVKVNADGIGGVKNVVGEFGSFLEVDAGIDDVITIVTNPQSYAWLTQDTLNNLDTVGISTFSRGQSWHDRLYSEFYEEYFPERVD